MMVKKVEEEGEKEKELYEAFMCACKSDMGNLQGAVDDANKKIPELESLIAELEALLKKLKADVEQHKKDRAAAKAAIEAAVEIRKKEAAAAKAESVDNTTTIAALKKAIAALEKGLGGAFLQTHAASVLKRLLRSDSPMMGNLMDADRDDLTSFLDAKGSEDSPGTSEIIGILKQMLDEYIASEHDGSDREEKANVAFKLTVKAKLTEIAALNKLVEDKLGRIGEISVKLAMSKNDLEDTQEALGDNSKMLADLEASCKTKTAEYEERCKSRAQELLALADTIKILNDDDALDLFKKTLPSASMLLQVKVTTSELRQRALAQIRSLRSVRPRIDLIALALKGKKIGFGEIIKMIDEMVATLKKEQADDDAKMEYCKNQLDITDDKLKELGHTLSDHESEISALQEDITTTTGEIDTLEDGIVALDKSVAQATEQRKEEYAEVLQPQALQSPPQARAHRGGANHLEQRGNLGAHRSARRYRGHWHWLLRAGCPDGCAGSRVRAGRVHEAGQRWRPGPDGPPGQGSHEGNHYCGGRGEKLAGGLREDVEGLRDQASGGLQVRHR